MDGKQLDFVVLDSVQQLVHGIVQNLGPIEQKTQVQSEYAAVACGQAKGIEARCTVIVPQQLQQLGRPPLRGSMLRKCIFNTPFQEYWQASSLLMVLHNQATGDYSYL